MMGSNRDFCTVYYRLIDEAVPGDTEYKKRERDLVLELLKQGFFKVFGLEYERDRVIFMEHGKPCWNGKEDVFFNISHCSGGIAAAFSNVPVGVDIEGIRRVRPGTVLRCCSEREREYVFLDGIWEGDSLPEDMAVRFLKLWTLKESFIKMTGDGLSYPLNRIFFHFGEPENREKMQESNALLPDSGQKGCLFYQRALREQKILSVCINHEKKEEIEIQFEER